MENQITILVDWNPPADWIFARRLKESFDQVQIYSSFSPKGYNSKVEKVLTLWKSYVLGGLKSTLRYRNSDIVYAWHAVLGLFFAIFCRIFHFTKPKIIISQLIIPDRGNSWAEKIKRWFVLSALKRVDSVITYSSVEQQKFTEKFSGLNINFEFIPLGFDLSDSIRVSERNYIFSAGRSNRDYQTLIEAVRNLDVTVKIVAQKFNFVGIDIPAHVEPYVGVFGREFDQLLAGAKIVVIPLDRADESSGQLVLLQAMACGKPVIVTDNRGIQDYIDPGDSVLTVPPHDIEAMNKAILQLLHDDERKSKLRQAAFEKAGQFSMQDFSDRIVIFLKKRFSTA